MILTRVFHLSERWGRLQLAYIFSSLSVSVCSAQRSEEDEEIRLLSFPISWHSYPSTLQSPYQTQNSLIPLSGQQREDQRYVFFLVSKTILCPLALGELLHPTVFLPTFQVLKLAGSKIELTYTYQALCSDAFNSVPEVEGHCSPIFILILLFSCLASSVRKSLKKTSTLVESCKNGQLLSRNCFMTHQHVSYPRCSVRT